MLVALTVFFCAGTWADSAGRELAGGLVRLHVVANSDSDADQAEKLQMRDRVLEMLAPLLENCHTRQEAETVILTNRARLEALGDVTVQLGREYYPTRHYDTFSLPAGEYVSLRVILGQGQGRNWWCVIFPPLCTQALAQPVTDVFEPLTGQDGLDGQEGMGYIIRFRLLEWWGMLVHALG